MAIEKKTDFALASRGDEMTRKCKRCGVSLYQDDRKLWFCPDCVVNTIDSAFLNETDDKTGALKRPYVLESLTKPVSIRLPVTDIQLARGLAKRKGIPKYQSYIKELLHTALVKETAVK